MTMSACVQRQTGRAWSRALIVLATVVVVGLIADWARAGEATEAMRGTIDEVLRILADKDLKQPSKTNERRQLLEKVVGERFDYQEMSRRSLGAQTGSSRRRRPGHSVQTTAPTVSSPALAAATHRSVRLHGCRASGWKRSSDNAGIRLRGARASAGRRAKRTRAR